jgi:DNA-binding NtrC family response regulator
MDFSSSQGPVEPDAEAHLSGTRILVVEDSWHIGQAVGELLQLVGAEVIGPVATATQAIGLLAERSPDAAIVDFTLRNGERADRVIDRLQAQGVPIIVISGNEALPAQTVKAAAAFLSKPFNDEQLLAVLRRALAPGPASERKTTS